MMIVITPYVVLDDWHIKRLCVIESQIAVSFYGRR